MTERPKARDRFIGTAARLFMRQGYHGTGLNQIVAESGAPKGSLYFHFPGGKEELAAAAVEQAGAVFAVQIDTILAANPNPAQAIAVLCQTLRSWMEKSYFREGCPITNACLELAPENAAVSAVTKAIFDGWRDAWERHLAQAGIAPLVATSFAAVIVTSLEGAFILARAAESGEPFDQICNGLTMCFSALVA
jgi:TetR/AcrR family transcriptional regulator, lmrAB and yxaGH operons repressor